MMQNQLRQPYRTVAITTVILSFISYVMPPSGIVRGSALARSVAGSPDAALPALQGAPAAQQLKEQGLYDSLAEALAAARYKVRWEDRPALKGLPPAYHAPNPSHRFAAYFTPTELHLAAFPSDLEAKTGARGAAPAEWRAAMRFIGYGYGENLIPVDDFAELAALDNRIEYRRSESAPTEWYVNKADGLEHGFTITAPPGTRAEGSPLRLALEVTGDLRAELVEEGQAIALRHVNGGMALRYGELHAYDANDQALSAQLRVEEGRVILEVEDANAVYPVTIDPLLTQQQKLMASDGEAEDRFGISVAMSGETVVVGADINDIGANGNQGSAYVFIRNGGAWSQQQQLTAGDGANSDWFGLSVAISGNTIVVGALGDDIGSNGNQGSAYVFVRNGGAWIEQQKLTADDGATDDWFGGSVAISGDTAVVGALNDDIGANSDQGSAYIFARNGGVWSQQQKLTAGDGAANDGFGTGVAISGDTVVVGSPLNDLGAGGNQGSVYVFVGAGGAWSLQQKLTDSEGDGYRLGASVAISEDTIVAGKWADIIRANQGQGSSYVFVRSGGAWSEQQKLTASDGAAGDFFGISVAVSGDTVIVGAVSDDVGANAGQGSAYVFVRNGGAWSEQQKLTASDGAADDRFGCSVAVSGNTVVAGASGADVGADLNQGSAYVFAIWGEQQKLTAGVGAANDLFGFSVAIGGDTAVVGAPGADIGANIYQGSAYVFVRTGATWQHPQILTASDGATENYFGWSVAISGDNVVVGARGSNNDKGSAYVFVRSGHAWIQQQKLTASDGAAGDFFGYSVAIDGDTAVVGAPQDDFKTNLDQGSAYVFVRASGVWSQQNKKLGAVDGAADDQFGYSVAISGDTVVAGAPGASIGANIKQGSAYVFARSGGAWSLQQKLVASDGAGNDWLGYSVAIDGDTAVVGAPQDDIKFNSNQGSAYVFERSGTTWSQQTKLAAIDGTAGAVFGLSVAIDGETAVVGAPLDDIWANSDQGSAYVFSRIGIKWEQQKLTSSKAVTGDRFGWSVAISGNSVLMGAPYDNSLYSDQGSAYVFARK